jgi:hypothetical protein
VQKIHFPFFLLFVQGHNFELAKIFKKLSNKFKQLYTPILASKKCVAQFG